MNKYGYKKLSINTALLAIGSFSSSLLGMLLVPLYTSILSTSDYGVVDLIVTTTSLLYPFTTLAIGEAIMRFALDKNNDRRSVYSIGVYLVIGGYLLILFFLPFIRRTTIGEYYLFFLLYYFFYCLHTVTSYFVKGIEEIKVYSVAGILNSIIVISCNICFLLVFRMGIVGYLLSSIIGQGMTTVFMFVYAGVYKYIVPFWKINNKLFRQMLSFSVPIVPNSISWWIANSSDKYVINYYGDVSQVGIYSISYKIPTIMMTIMGFFLSAWQISAVDDFGTEKSRLFFSDVLKKIFAVNTILAALLVAFSKIMGYFLYSADFFVAWKFVPVLIIANVFNIIASFMGTIYTAAKKTKMLSLSTMIAATLNIILNFLLIPVIGAMGAAVATAVSYFIMLVIRIKNTKHIMKLEYSEWKGGIIVILLVMEATLLDIDKFITQIGTLCIVAVVLFINRSIIKDMLCVAVNAISSRLKIRKED